MGTRVAENWSLVPGDADYPVLPANDPHALAVGEIWGRGDRALLRLKRIALFGSARCPGRAILAALDWARAPRPPGVAVIGGFHSPVERECLDFLLAAGTPAILCPAREIVRYRPSPALLAAIHAGRLLLLSPFEKASRITAELAEQRNRFVATLAPEGVAIHATVGGKVERLLDEMRATGRHITLLGGG